MPSSGTLLPIVYVAVATELVVIPDLKARALTTVDVLMVNGAEYTLDVVVGSVPFVVNRMVAPVVAHLRVTETADE